MVEPMTVALQKIVERAKVHIPGRMELSMLVTFLPVIVTGKVVTSLPMALCIQASLKMANTTA
jgi:hypothetical protein